jgi:pyridoxamine 5'-phosphate oxidase
MEFSQPTREDLAKMRRDYNEISLDETQIDPSGNPWPLFRKWLDEAIAAKVTEPNAMCLSTITS